MMFRRRRGKIVRKARGSAAAPREGEGGGPQQLITYLARGLVDEPSGVSVSEVERADARVYELRVAMGDLGKVIGKNGRTAQAMRALLGLAKTEEDRDLVLDIVD
jgi:predicted RNA-binding protein YlqC (UPF0109 family)